MRIHHNDKHEHITIEDLRMVAKADAVGIENQGAEEKARYYETKYKITSCHECRRKAAIAFVTRKLFGVPIWELKQDEEFAIDLRREAGLLEHIV